MKQFMARVLIFVATALIPYTLVAAEDASVAQATSLTDGDVKKIDKDNGKLTIKHGPLDNLGMPAMTMVFRVKDTALLDKIKPGDRIRFLAEKLDGLLTVTRLEVVSP